MGLRSFVNGIGLVIVFTIALMFFMTQMIQTNNPTGVVSNQPFINSTLNGLQSSANDLTTVANNAKTRLESDQPSVVYIFLIIYSALAIPFAFISFGVVSVGRVITLMFALIFGAGASPFSIVAEVISAILLISIVFYIMRAVRTGETER